jgi:hypothetical protein
MAPKLATVLALVAVACVLLSTVFGVSHLSEWLLDAAQGLFVIAFIIFAVYVVSGIVRDARAL